MKICDLHNGKKLNIRKAELKDAAEIVSVAVKLGGETDFFTYSEDDYYFNEEQQKNFIGNINDKKNYLFLVGIIDNNIVGTLTYISSPRKRTMHRGELGIGIVKEYWGIGVASSLLDYFFKWALMQEQVKKVDLEVREDNIRAVNLYLKHGFKIEGKISRGIQVDGRYYDLYCMGKTIG